MSETNAAEASTITLPVIDWSAAANPLPQAALDAFWQRVDEKLAQDNEDSRRRHEVAVQRWPDAKLFQLALFSDAEKAALRTYLDSDARHPPPREHPTAPGRDWYPVLPALRELLLQHEVTPVTLWKMLQFFDIASDQRRRGLHFHGVDLIGVLHQRTGRPTMLELSRMLDDCNENEHLRGHMLVYAHCGSGLVFNGDAASVWPYFVHQADYVLKVLQMSTDSYWFNRGRLFSSIGSIPQPPALLWDALFALAVGSAKGDRVLAQKTLAAWPGREARIVEALADGKSEVRAQAALWLARLRHAAALPALEAAVRKEKQDVAKGALLDALIAFGQPVEAYLNRDVMAADAAKLLAKGLTTDLDWFPWARLPAVRWADDGQPVPVDILRWLLAQAVKLKSPEPTAMLLKTCSLFNAADRETFGQFVLDNWLAEDERTGAQAGGSAIVCKGLLAVAAACAGSGAAPAAQRFLKTWYGLRPSQCKSLVAMLAWIEHPSATQLMLAIGSRFRTKGIQDEATKQAQALADRKGWTLADLSDRTVPSCGFDETGTLELDFGPRAFTAKLRPDLKVDLLNPEGKAIAALPDPRQDDDAELAAAAKKALATTKKELKGIAALQADRLYEAMCTEREWSFADWRDYLQQHPVMRHLVQRLVWLQVDGGHALQVFRPLDDGTLTDRHDAAVTLPDTARIRLAHDTLLSDDDVAGWRTHLVDYEIAPLFQQFGKGRWQLPTAQAAARELKDFEGHLLQAFALRNRAQKLGYARGASEDGGWFYSYDKRFPTLGLQAMIRFSGNSLPEDNRKVALDSLLFTGTDTQPGVVATGLPLSEVPAILLAECREDIRLIAAEGSGFAADWSAQVSGQG